MKLISKVRKITPPFIKKIIWNIINKIPKRFELPFQYWYCQLRVPLEEEMGLLKELVGEGGTAIDIGANIGFYSYALSKICKNVEAFEPNLACLQILKAYDAKNVRTHNIGLSSKPGTLTLHIPIFNGKESAGHATVNSLDVEHLSINISVKKLDDYAFKKVSFIKIDVEGHEYEVIKGAEETLLREKPTLLIEIEQRHLNFPMTLIFDKLTNLGYNGYFLYEDKLQPLCNFSYEFHQKSVIEAIASRKYVNNFIFKPAY